MAERTRQVRKDLLMLKQMAERSRELLAEFDNLSPSEREYAANLIQDFDRLVKDFKRTLDKTK